MIKNLILLALALVVVNTATAQTVEEYKSQIAAKKDQITALEGEVGALETKILEFPGWTFGSFGIIGANLQGFNDWFNVDNPNSSTANITVGLNGFARLNEDKYFWRNDAKLNLGWSRTIENVLENDLPTNLNPIEFSKVADALNITSLAGYKLTPKIALSVLADYRTTVLENFNNPGYLDIGAGVTWLPVKDLIITLHPLNYNLIFSDQDDVFESSLGLKYVVDYTRSLPVLNGVSWSSKLSGFYSYKSNDLSNWTWINGLGFKAWRGIGISAEFGLRGSNQEFLSNIKNTALAAGRTQAQVDAINFENVDAEATALGTQTGLDIPDSSPVQSYWLIGLSYTL